MLNHRDDRFVFFIFVPLKATCEFWNFRDFRLFDLSTRKPSLMVFTTKVEESTSMLDKVTPAKSPLERIHGHGRNLITAI